MVQYRSCTDDTKQSDNWLIAVPAFYNTKLNVNQILHSNFPTKTATYCVWIFGNYERQLAADSYSKAIYHKIFYESTFNNIERIILYLLQKALAVHIQIK